MPLNPSLIPFLLSSDLTSCHYLLPDGRTIKESSKGAQNGDLLDRQPREFVTLRILDFSEDNDQQSDNSSEHTSATLEAGSLPESFTICSAFKVKAWTTEFSSAHLFVVPDDLGAKWADINLFAADSHTEYQVSLGVVFFVRKVETAFFPHQWIRACLSLDSVAGKVTLVEEGQG